ncbi:hypothetical protein GCM10008929_17780 [Alkalibacterium psychrotolerans]
MTNLEYYINSEKHHSFEKDFNDDYEVLLDETSDYILYDNYYYENLIH